MHLTNQGGSLPSVVANVLDCIIVTSKFELQSGYYIQFRTKTLGKIINPIKSPPIGQIVPLLFFYKVSALNNPRRFICN